MARRTFIGNIYKLVKDPNLVSSLTGHVEGSRAFNRYRTIDIEMKKDLFKMLEGIKYILIWLTLLSGKTPDGLL